jgi:hypothetical protein
MHKKAVDDEQLRGLGKQISSAIGGKEVGPHVSAFHKPSASIAFLF